MKTIDTRPPCLGEQICAHWRGERLGGLCSRTKLTHGDNLEHSRIFEAGVMLEGVCAKGHDIALERWIHEVEARAHGGSHDDRE